MIRRQCLAAYWSLNIMLGTFFISCFLGTGPLSIRALAWSLRLMWRRQTLSWTAGRTPSGHCQHCVLGTWFLCFHPWDDEWCPSKRAKDAHVFSILSSGDGLKTSVETLAIRTSSRTEHVDCESTGDLEPYRDLFQHAIARGLPMLPGKCPVPLKVAPPLGQS